MLDDKNTTFPIDPRVRLNEISEQPPVGELL